MHVPRPLMGKILRSFLLFSSVRIESTCQFTFQWLWNGLRKESRIQGIQDGHETGCPSFFSSWLFGFVKICKWPTHWNQDLISTHVLFRVDKSFPSVTLLDSPLEIVLLPHTQIESWQVFPWHVHCGRFPSWESKGLVKGVNEAVQVCKIFHQILRSFITFTIQAINLGQWPW